MLGRDDIQREEIKLFLITLLPPWFVSGCIQGGGGGTAGDVDWPRLHLSPFYFSHPCHPDLRRGFFFSCASGLGIFPPLFPNSFVSSLTRTVALRFSLSPPFSIVCETWKNSASLDSAVKPGI